MGAPSGNQFWKQRSKHGRDKTFSTPEILWESACEYFEWCDSHPWNKVEAAKAGDHFGEHVHIPTQRPYTLKGLAIFLDVDSDTINNYGSKDQYKDFFGIVSKIKDIVYTQKFEGAVVGAFNSNIIARDLGLTDNQNINLRDGMQFDCKWNEDKD